MTTNERKHMKPFCLEAAKAGEPIVFRNKQPVKFVAHEPDANENSRVIILSNGSIGSWAECGNVYPNGRTSEYDLFMAMQKKTVFVNFYENGMAAHYETKRIALDHADATRVIALAVPVEIEI